MMRDLGGEPFQQGHAGSLPDDFSPEWVRDHIPTVLPAGWRLESFGAFSSGRPAGLALGPCGARYLSRFGLCAILSGDGEMDGRRWLHLSVSHVHRLPRWDELREAKQLFLGKESLVVQVLPPESRYINIHSHVLHLWRCLDGDPVPDFTRGTDRL